MKVVLTIFFCVCCSVVTNAQEPPSDSSASPPITVKKLKWSREYQQPLYNRRAGNPATAAIPDWFPTLETMRLPESRSEPSYNPFPPGGRLSYVYVYTAKVVNESGQAIRAVSWDYVVSDPASKEELTRHHFYSRDKIGKHSEAILRGRSAAAPSNVVSVAGLEKDQRSPFDERVEFRCVIYADGTFWQSPSARELECLHLKNRPAMRRRPRF